MGPKTNKINNAGGSLTSPPSTMQTPIASNNKRSIDAATVTSPEPWLRVKGGLFTVMDAGELKNIKFTAKDGHEVLTNLHQIDGYMADGTKIRFETWGKAETELLANFYSKAVNRMGRYLFAMQDTDHVPETDCEKLVFVKHEPNKYQQQFKAVYKLQTKSKRKTSTSTTLIPESFPRVVNWKEDTYFDENGSPVRHPRTWSEKSLDDSRVNLDELLQATEIEAPLPKKFKTEGEN